jgi:hypothetical protein
MTEPRTASTYRGARRNDGRRDIKDIKHAARAIWARRASPYTAETEARRFERTRTTPRQAQS